MPKKIITKGVIYPPVAGHLTKKAWAERVNAIACSNPVCSTHVSHTIGKCDACLKSGYVIPLTFANGMRCSICTDCWAEVSSQKGVEGNGICQKA